MLSGVLFYCLHTLCLALRVNRTGSFPRPLTPEEERDCLRRLAAGDVDARNELIEHNLRLVAHIIKKYYSTGVDTDDLISIGTIGLIKAISSFSPERGTRLATYTARCIENEILMFFRAQKRVSSEVSLSEPIDSDGDGNTLALMDVISEDDDMAERIDEQDRTLRLRACIQSALDDRERQIIALRYGVPDGKKCMTQREAAQICGISRSYVSRIEKKALEKLKEAFEKPR
ncbi:MAG: RNA polymerase sporulation sigma factor SigK [Clostridiaceae bacterium]|nr:RNA polymerase sporulation sigma factor SigK [Clostridiaceae bacterium]